MSSLLLHSTIVAIGLMGMGSVMGAAHASANSSTEVRFATGQLSSQVTGVLTPKQDERWYRFNALSGQYAIINIAPLSGTNIAVSETANVGILHMPDGTQDGTKGGIIYQGCLPVSGQYRLRIARNLMATEGGRAGYTAEIMILPRYASQELCP